MFAGVHPGYCHGYSQFLGPYDALVLWTRMRGDRVAVQEESTRVEDPPVAVNVTRRIKPGRVGDFEEWVSGI